MLIVEGWLHSGDISLRIFPLRSKHNENTALFQTIVDISLKTLAKDTPLFPHKDEVFCVLNLW